MSYTESRQIEIGEGYLLKFTIVDAWSIKYTVLAEKDPTLHTGTDIELQTESIYRNGDLEGNEPTLKESMRDFSTRALAEAREFAVGVIQDHKESQELFSMLSEEISNS